MHNPYSYASKYCTWYSLLRKMNFLQVKALELQMNNSNPLLQVSTGFELGQIEGHRC